MQFTGERVVWNNMKADFGRHITLVQHLYRYTQAMKYTYNKVVLDAACGTGYGSMLISQTASKVILADKSNEAIEECKKLTYNSQKEFVVADFSTQILPKADILISFETIEHLLNPDFFLANADVKEFFVSIPINNQSTYHLQVWESTDDIKKFLSEYINIQFEEIQDNLFYICYGSKK